MKEENQDGSIRKKLLEVLLSSKIISPSMTGKVTIILSKGEISDIFIERSIKADYQ